MFKRTTEGISKSCFLLVVLNRPCPKVRNSLFSGALSGHPNKLERTVTDDYGRKSLSCGPQEHEIFTRASATSEKNGSFQLNFLC